MKGLTTDALIAVQRLNRVVTSQPLVCIWVSRLSNACIGSTALLTITQNSHPRNSNQTKPSITKQNQPNQPTKQTLNQSNPNQTHQNQTNPNQTKHQITKLLNQPGTDADLRKLPHARAGELLRTKFGFSQEEVDGLGRWARIDAIRTKCRC